MADAAVPGAIGTQPDPHPLAIKRDGVIAELTRPRFVMSCQAPKSHADTGRHDGTVATREATCNGAWNHIRSSRNARNAATISGSASVGA
jgi:hypothetical protein